MKKPKILFVSQEIFPYLEESAMANIGRFLPQGIQERGKEIRTFMPRFGLINERRNQLHEVIRLSGMNIIVDDTDHPLIIKVASIQSARMQVYFIDNEEYFQRKHLFTDANNNHFDDNDERSLFFCKGVIETVKKLGWAPDIIHCHGWMSNAMPVLIKKVYAEDPLFAETKVIYSVYDDVFDKTLNKKYITKVAAEGVTEAELKRLKDPTYINVTKHAIDFSDAVIKSSENIDAEISKHLKGLDIPVLEYHPLETYIDAFSAFYDEVLVNETILAE